MASRPCDVVSRGYGNTAGAINTAGSSRYFDSYNYPPFLGRAVVLINDETYYEWESVQVHLTIGDPPSTFQLTVSEQEPWPEDWAFLRIRPGDDCAVYLDGELVITGWVITRQVYYDANQRSVQIQGMGRTGILGHVTADTATNEIKNLPPMQITQQIAGNAGVATATAGSMPNNKIERFSITPGQSCREAIEEVCRAGGLKLGETKHGELLLIGDGAIGPGGELSTAEFTQVIEVSEKTRALTEELARLREAKKNFRFAREQHDQDETISDLLADYYTSRSH